MPPFTLKFDELAGPSHAGLSRTAPLVDDVGARPTRPLEARRLSPAVTLLLCFHEGLRFGICHGLLETGSRILYCASTVVAILVFVLWLARHDILLIDRIEWFGVTVFVLFAIAELLLYASRVFARYKHLGKHRKEATDAQKGFFGLLHQLVHRDPFGALWQAIVVLILQAIIGILMLFGMLVIIAELASSVGTVETHALWTAVFVFQAFCLCFSGFAESVRLAEIDYASGWFLALELTAWRVILYTFVLPILSIAYTVYVLVCCPGDWVIRFDLWFS